MIVFILLKPKLAVVRQLLTYALFCYLPPCLLCPLHQRFLMILLNCLNGSLDNRKPSELYIESPRIKKAEIKGQQIKRP